jgi:hypothetical protein
MLFSFLLSSFIKNIPLFFYIRVSKGSYCIPERKCGIPFDEEK